MFYNKDSERAPSADGTGDASHVNEDKDLDSGLMGPMIVTRRGAALADGTPRNVDREFVVSFHEVDENESWYLEDNIQAYTSDPASADRRETAFLPFGASNFMESINGFIYGHLPARLARCLRASRTSGAWLLVVVVHRRA